MSFDTTKRFYAFTATTLQSASALRDGLGELASTAPDANGTEIRTLLCALDNSETGKFRALELGVTAIPQLLTDGRYCLGGYWAVGVVDAVESGEIAGEELTIDQVKSLQPTSEL